MASISGPAFNAGGLTVTGDGFLFPLDDNTLHHYVGIVEAGVGIKLYRDGELVAEAAGSPNFANSSSNLLIGGNPEAPAAEGPRSWEGLIDDVGVWSRPLTPAEIALLWNNGDGVPISEAINPADSDNDGMPDFYENSNGLDPNDPADADQGDDDGLFDNDGLTNLEEFQRGTDPNKADSDDDGVEDGPEVDGSANPFANTPTNPLLADSDSDGLTDGEEISGSQNPFGNAPTDPNEADSDGDGATDPQEIAFNFDPNDPNSSPPPWQRGLRGFWSFDDTLEDGSGLQHHGTLFGSDTVPRYAPGKLGKSILLDGRTGFNQYVEVAGNEGDLDFPGASMTVSAWVRFSFAPSDEPCIVAKGTDPNWRLALNGSSTVLRFAGGADFLEGGGSIRGPVWHHAVA